MKGEDTLKLIAMIKDKTSAFPNETHNVNCNFIAIEFNGETIKFPAHKSEDLLIRINYVDLS